MLVSLSFDDAHPNDLRLARLLKKRGLKATFYAPLANAEGPVLAPKRLGALAQLGMEVGSHGLSHRRLHRLGELEARRELFLSKQRLEAALDAPVRGFCFPGGEYHRRLPLWAAQEGYDYCRSTRMFRSGRMLAGNLLHSSLQWWPHSLLRYARHWLRRPGLRSALELASASGGLEQGARRAFQRCQRLGLPFHLWGHSYEFQAPEDWARLEAFLEFIARRPGVSYVDNSGLYDALVHA